LGNFQPLFFIINANVSFIIADLRDLREKSIAKSPADYAELRKYNLKINM